MSNPRDHLGTPPPPSPSNSSSSTPHNVSPKPRFRRQKMLARKTITSGALRKVLNERLKASQVKESPAPKSDSSSESESFQSATEGDGHGSSDYEKTQESPSEVSSSVVENLETRFVLVGPIRDVELPEMSRSGGKKKSEKEKERNGACGEERGKGKGAVLAICGVAQDRLDESGMKSGGSDSGEATEGLVHLSKQRDELVSSTEETLADLLKKVGASYDPKKRNATTQKTPNVPKPSKKRKASSAKPTTYSVPRGRATRSRVKQSEADLQKALEESKKRKKDKGKGKVAKSSEAVEEEEMELVHQ
ncbi:protein gar2-like [Nicotiana sylvestris]|uniref:protein gar2-like n=1 Tax=Nicotiana sylvestris TaxID=4096 RepID=UPI00388C37FB